MATKKEKTAQDIALAEIKKNKYSAFVCVGISENGSIGVNSTHGNAAVMHWLLNRGIFELNLVERAKNQTEGTS